MSLGLSGDVILTVLVVGFGSVFTVRPGVFGLGDYVLLALASLLYLINGIYGWRYWDRTRAPLFGLVYFASQCALSAFILYWSYQTIWLLLLALASQSVALRRRWTAVVCLMLVIAFTLPLVWPARLIAGGLMPPEDATLMTVLEATFSFVMALVFVLMFSELVVRERQARAELDEAHRRLSEDADQVEQLATMRERTRLAREVHDSLGHYLTVLSVQLEIMTRFLDADPARAREAALKS